MRRVGPGWRWLGRLPAVAVVGAIFAFVGIALLLLDRSTDEVAGLGLLGALVVYCVARPRGGWQVFLTAGFPGAASTLLNDIVGTPRWLGFLFIPFALMVIWSEDSERSVA